MRQFHNDKKIMTHVFLSCVVIAVLLLLSVQPAIADYNFDGVPFRDCLYEVKQGSVKEGGVYVDGGHGAGPSPYTQSFNVPGGEVKWARLYVGVWGGNEENTGSVAVTFNSQEIDTLELKGKTDTNPNVYCSGHGVYWIYYDVTDKTTSGPLDAVVTTSGDIDGRVYGIVLVAVYEEPDGEEVKYWINEGNVNLHAGDLKTNNEAVAEFTDTVDVDKFAIARLTVVYLAGTPGLNDYLYFNDEKLCDGDNCDDMANSKQSFDIKAFDLIEQLENKANKAKFELGDEDYVRPVLAVLSLHAEEEEGDSVLTVSSVNVPAAAQEPEINGYAADKPLSTFSHDTIKGGLTYTIGDSYYSGKLWTNETYTVHCDVALPEGAVLEFARLYNYWTWSAKGTTGRYPDMMVTFNGVKLEADRQYSDRKGWGIYDYPAGTWVYDVTDHITESGTYTAVVVNTGPDGSFFSMNGVGLLIVYKDEEGKYIEYWVNEGCDMPYSGLEDDGTSIYTTPDQTITEMMTPTISHDPIGKATLWTIVQSGNWDANRLWVNDMDWSGICDGTPYPDLDIDIRDITGHLAVGKNTIRFQAVEDYAVPSGSFLVVEIEPTAEGASASEGIPGFEAVPTITLIVIISLLTFRKCKKANHSD